MLGMQKVKALSEAPKQAVVMSGLALAIAIVALLVALGGNHRGIQ